MVHVAALDELSTARNITLVLPTGKLRLSFNGAADAPAVPVTTSVSAELSTTLGYVKLKVPAATVAK
jgi:hypothetical protein